MSGKGSRASDRIVKRLVISTMESGFNSCLGRNRLGVRYGLLMTRNNQKTPFKSSYLITHQLVRLRKSISDFIVLVQ